MENQVLQYIDGSWGYCKYYSQYDVLFSRANDKSSPLAKSTIEIADRLKSSNFYQYNKLSITKKWFKKKAPSGANFDVNDFI